LAVVNRAKLKKTLKNSGQIECRVPAILFLPNNALIRLGDRRHFIAGTGRETVSLRIGTQEDMVVSIRRFQAGDEVAQVAIFNTAAGSLPGCKLATVEDLRRRMAAPMADPDLVHVAEDGGKLVGYCSAQTNGRISFPWCLPGHEGQSGPLFEATLAALKQRGVRPAFAAYASSWTAQADFFLAQKFTRAREIVNFIQELTNLPTLLVQSGDSVTPLEPADVPAVMAMAPELWRNQSADVLRREWFENPLAPPSTLFAVRNRVDQQPIAVGRLIENPAYADPAKIDATQPCFRLGAFGTEGMSHKRVNGLFSLVLPRSRNAMGSALDLLAHAAAQHDGAVSKSIAAQVPSDAPHLLTFYKSHFQKQASFPIFERTLTD
jgi:hypothetical protein